MAPMQEPLKAKDKGINGLKHQRCADKLEIFKGKLKGQDE
jgi:hypothetical protein